MLAPIHTSEREKPGITRLVRSEATFEKCLILSGEFVPQCLNAGEFADRFAPVGLRLFHDTLQYRTFGAQIFGMHMGGEPNSLQP
jgi:hypothetical protein